MSYAPSVDTGRLLELRQVNGLTYEEIGQLVGISPSTVFERLKRLEAILPDKSAIGVFRERRADILSGLQAGLVAHMAECLEDENRRDKISPYQAAGMFGLIYDKERLETGKSTSNIAALTRIVENAQDSGDKALRNQVLEPGKAKIINQD